MALLVWLPLNGNLKNLGLADINLINSGATISSEGKIGLCYSFDGSDDYLYTSNYTNLGNNFSVACWVYFNIISTGCILCTRSATYSGLFIYLSSGNMEIDPTASSFSNGVNRWTTTFAPQTKTWYHLVITRTPTEISYYINGELLLTKTVTYGDNYGNTLTIGCRSTNGGSRGVFLNGKLNDLRIYDHCLSLKEIKEISKGLVLHYKLDDMMRSNENLLPTASLRMSETGQTSTNEYMNLCSCINIWDNYGLVPYTISFEIKAAVAHSFNIYGDYGSKPKYGFSRKSINVTTEWQRFSHTFTPYLNDDSGTWAGISVYGIYGSGAIVSVRKVKLELGTIETPLFIDDKIVYDSSGYENNGIISGNLIINNNTPRYNISTKFDGDSYIYLVSPPTIEVKTISLWVKWDTMDFSGNYAGQSVIFVDNGSKIGLGLYSGGILLVTSGAGGNGYAYPKTNLTANTWYHFVIISTGTTTRDLYINGIKLTKNSSTSNWSYSINLLLLGRRSTTTDGFKGQISDFRMYITALSGNDVVELYNTSAIVDNAKNNLAYLFNENGQTPNLLDLALRALINKLWKDCLLNSSSLPKAVVTLTDYGLRVYREPNNTSTTSGSGKGKLSNWGGFVLTNTDNMFGLLNGHTYLILVDVKGKSDRALSDYGWRHHVGWNYTNTGIAPAPTNTVLLNPITANFNTEEWLLLSYKFTISDSVYKVATTTYLYHTEGETYLAYYLFKFGWTYGTTGEIGTDVYFSNLRMFDVTSIPKEININKLGILDTFQLSENENVAFIDYYCGSISNQFIEI